MRTTRQNAILSLIEAKAIETQQELTDELISMGLNVTQATVSRDIKDLRLVKIQTVDGKYRYAHAGTAQGPTDDSSRIHAIFSHSVVSIDYAVNNIVIKTLSGMAQAAAITLEGMNLPEILGTIGGDDTVLVVVRSENHAKKLTEQLKKMIVR